MFIESCTPGVQDAGRLNAALDGSSTVACALQPEAAGGTGLAALGRREPLDLPGHACASGLRQRPRRSQPAQRAAESANPARLLAPHAQADLRRADPASQARASARISRRDLRLRDAALSLPGNLRARRVLVCGTDRPAVDLRLRREHRNRDALLQVAVSPERSAFVRARSRDVRAAAPQRGGESAPKRPSPQRRARERAGRRRVLRRGEPRRIAADESRSGERRVGKESRSWWWPYHLKKK